MKISRQNIIYDILHIFKIIQKAPTKKEYKLYGGKYGINTIVKNFGTFNNAIEFVTGSIGAKTPEPKKQYYCTKCNKSFKRNPSEAAKSINLFCSQSCAAKYNNKTKQKKQKTKKCKNCSKLIYASNIYCPKCISQNKHIRGYLDIENKTLIYFKNLRNDSSRYTYIRQHARKITSHRSQICVNCGYNKHIEVCHIKEIKNFEPQTKIKIINNPKNLIILCPNCHWEMDNNLLDPIGFEPITTPL